MTRALQSTLLGTFDGFTTYMTRRSRTSSVFNWIASREQHFTELILSLGKPYGEKSGLVMEFFHKGGGGLDPLHNF